jgi:hypothetical protein
MPTIMVMTKNNRKRTTYEPNDAIFNSSKKLVFIIVESKSNVIKSNESKSNENLKNSLLEKKDLEVAVLA